MREVRYNDEPVREGYGEGVVVGGKGEPSRLIHEGKNFKANKHGLHARGNLGGKEQGKGK